MKKTSFDAAGVGDVNTEGSTNGEQGLKIARRSIATKQSAGEAPKELFGATILKVIAIASQMLDFSKNWSKIDLYNGVQPSCNKVV